MKHAWRVYFNIEPLTLGHDQIQRWLADNTTVVIADRKYVNAGNTLQFMNVVEPPPVDASELCGEKCRNGKPCVRKKDHADDKWGHKASLSAKKDKDLELLGIRDFPPGLWEGGCRLIVKEDA